MMSVAVYTLYICFYPFYILATVISWLNKLRRYTGTVEYCNFHKNLGLILIMGIRWNSYIVAYCGDGNVWQLSSATEPICRLSSMHTRTLRTLGCFRTPKTLSTRVTSEDIDLKTATPWQQRHVPQPDGRGIPLWPRVNVCWFFRLTIYCPWNYTVFQTRSPFSFRCSFYKQRPIFVIGLFGTQYRPTEINCNTAVTDLPTSLAYWCYTILGKFELHNNDFINTC